jgi:hypothetical protein
MKNRVKDKDEAREIICDFHGRKISIVGCRGLENVSIKRIIPMDYSHRKQIHDVEILTNRKKNHYFSIGAILKKQSRITKFKLGEINLKSRQMEIINPTPNNEIDWIRTARFINLLKIKFNQ